MQQLLGLFVIALVSRLNREVIYLFVTEVMLYSGNFKQASQRKRTIFSTLIIDQDFTPFDFIILNTLAGNITVSRKDMHTHS